ncbi:hypothetical protein HZA38_06545 [Candidatus Peregrinibacteria bacterium]|nr:hypothetical protein [Candidatus Peregrinibacteria bacterium]
MSIRKYSIILSCFFLITFVLATSVAVRADEYLSPSFVLKDSVVALEGGRSSTETFQYFSSSGQLPSGEATSETFVQRTGFLFFPTASSSVITATPGNGSVSLAWSPSTGTLGNVSNYLVGIATNPGGPYTFESVGNVVAFVKSNLTNGTTYYFIVRAQAGGESLSESAEVSGAPVAPVQPPQIPPASGGSGGGGSSSSTVPSTPSNPTNPNPNANDISTGVIFLGRAYPLSRVTVLKDGQKAIMSIAGPNGEFSVSLLRISAGTYNFSIFTEDSKGLLSEPFTFSMSINAGAATTISGIFLSPTISMDKSEVEKGEDIAIFGQSIPNAKITIAVNSDEPFLESTVSDNSGVYLYDFDTSVLEEGEHLTKAKARLKQEVTPFGKSVSFFVGDKTLPKEEETCGKADVNCDGKVNLVDFSITGFWYGRTVDGEFLQIEEMELNGDGKVDLVDFSIMAFYWTG